MEIEIQRHFEARAEFPSDDELRQAGLAIVQTMDSIVEASQSPASSWFRDIFMPHDGTRALKHDGTSGQQHDQAEVGAKTNKGFFGECDLELQLRRYVRMHVSLGQEVADDKLQTEACRILRHIEGSSLYSSRYLLGFFIRLIWSSTAWLAPLRARATQDLLSIEDTGMVPEPNPGTAGGNIALNAVVDSRPQNPDESMSQVISAPTNPGTIDFHLLGPQSLWPSTLEDDMWCTITDPNIHSLATAVNNGSSLFAGSNPGTSDNAEDVAGKTRFRMPSDYFIFSGYSDPRNAPYRRTKTSWPDNAYQRLARGLSLYVMKAMSPHNPQCHVPTDDELRYQGRWLLYDE